jgi:hypothetical protein
VTVNNSKIGAEKPVSLWGALFTDVLAALLKTKPISKNHKKLKQVKTVDHA